MIIETVQQITQKIISEAIIDNSSAFASIILQDTLVIFSLFFVIITFLMNNDINKYEGYRKYILHIENNIIIGRKTIVIGFILVLMNSSILLFQINNSMLLIIDLILFIIVNAVIFYNFSQIYGLYNIKRLEDCHIELPEENIKFNEEMVKMLEEFLTSIKKIPLNDYQIQKKVEIENQIKSCKNQIKSCKNQIKSNKSLIKKMDKIKVSYRLKDSFENQRESEAHENKLRDKIAEERKKEQ
ncbi:hypothetical protein HNV12_19320 [Methanococcoides sp. SA1]|nr:hypothetical protein [Methanococcoides sp. SA1]